MVWWKSRAKCPQGNRRSASSREACQSIGPRRVWPAGPPPPRSARRPLSPPAPRGLCEWFSRRRLHDTLDRAAELGVLMGGTGGMAVPNVVEGFHGRPQEARDLAAVAQRLDLLPVGEGAVVAQAGALGRLEDGPEVETVD